MSTGPLATLGVFEKTANQGTYHHIEGDPHMALLNHSGRCVSPQAGRRATPGRACRAGLPTTASPWAPQDGALNTQRNVLERLWSELREYLGKRKYTLQGNPSEQNGWMILFKQKLFPNFLVSEL